MWKETAKVITIHSLRVLALQAGEAIIAPWVLNHVQVNLPSAPTSMILLVLHFKEVVAAELPKQEVVLFKSLVVSDQNWRAAFG